MQVRYIQNFHYFSRGDCAVCGGSFETATEQPFAYDAAGAELGLLCDSCAGASTAELARRARAQSSLLHEYAAGLARLAPSR